MLTHVKIVDPWETGKPTQIPPEVKVTALQKGGPNGPFFISVYVDDFIMVSVPVDSFHQTALVVSVSLASDHVRLLGSGEKDEVPILAPNKSTDWNSIVDTLGLTINTHTMRISITKERVRCHSRHIRAGLAKRKSVCASARCVEYGVKNCEN